MKTSLAAVVIALISSVSYDKQQAQKNQGFHLHEQAGSDFLGAIPRKWNLSKIMPARRHLGLL